MGGDEDVELAGVVADTFGKPCGGEHLVEGVADVFRVAVDAGGRPSAYLAALRYAAEAARHAGERTALQLGEYAGLWHGWRTYSAPAISGRRYPPARRRLAGGLAKGFAHWRNPSVVSPLCVRYWAVRQRRSAALQRAERAVQVTAPTGCVGSADAFLAALSAAYLLERGLAALQCAVAAFLALLRYAAGAALPAGRLCSQLAP